MQTTRPEIVFTMSLKDSPQHVHINPQVTNDERTKRGTDDELQSLQATADAPPPTEEPRTRNPRGERGYGKAERHLEWGRSDYVKKFLATRRHPCHRGTDAQGSEDGLSHLRLQDKQIE